MSNKMDDVDDDDLLVLNMNALGEYVKDIQPGWGPAICLALLLREQKPTWRRYQHVHCAEWQRLDDLRKKTPHLRLPGIHKEPDGYISGFRKSGIVNVPGKPYRRASR